MFPTIRSRSDLQTSCPECTRPVAPARLDSVAPQPVGPRPHECLYALETLVRLRLSTTLHRIAPTTSGLSGSRTLGRTDGWMDGELQIRANRRNAIVILSLWRSASRMLQRCVLNGVTRTETVGDRRDDTEELALVKMKE